MDPMKKQNVKYHSRQLHRTDCCSIVIVEYMPRHLPVDVFNSSKKAALSNSQQPSRQS